jgi:hypothetical protein
MDSNAIARIMIAALKDPDMVNRTTAIRYLGGKNPAVAIPALLPLLDNPKDYDYAVIGLSLSSYGAAAKVAVPKLLSLYTNHWNIELMWALKAIDMEAAAQAEQLMVNSGPLNNARKGYTRTKLANGLELIAGGYIHTEIPTVNNRELSRAELLDPKTGKWTETGEMNTARDGHTATLLPNGKVLVEGGYGSGVIGKKPPVLSSKELYDPATGTWTAITNK